MNTRMLGTLFASCLALSVTTVAFGEPDAPTPLQLRHDSVVAPSSGSAASAGWKLAGIAVVIAGVALWLRKKRRNGLGDSLPSPTLRVVARTSVGARSELIVVDVGGQRVLLGATPSSINHLVDIDTDDLLHEATKPALRGTMGSRFHALLEGALTEKDARPEEVVETQAKNLVVLRKRL